MPQLDPSSFSSQLFWLTISFLMLYVMLARALLPRIRSVLTFREQTLSGDLEQARKMKADAELAREHYEKALTQARLSSQALMADTQQSIAARSLKRQAELDAQIAGKLSEAQAKVEGATRKAKESLSTAAEELAVSITKALAGHTPDAKAVKSTVSALLKE